IAVRVHLLERIAQSRAFLVSPGLPLARITGSATGQELAIDRYAVAARVGAVPSPAPILAGIPDFITGVTCLALVRLNSTTGVDHRRDVVIGTGTRCGHGNAIVARRLWRAGVFGVDFQVGPALSCLDGRPE